MSTENQQSENRVQLPGNIVVAYGAPYTYSVSGPGFCTGSSDVSKLIEPLFRDIRWLRAEEKKELYSLMLKMISEGLLDLDKIGTV